MEAIRDRLVPDAFHFFARLRADAGAKDAREADAEVRSMQPKEINILSIMKDLVSVQSDTGTRQEERALEKNCRVL